MESSCSSRSSRVQLNPRVDGNFNVFMAFQVVEENIYAHLMYLDFIMM